MYYFQIAATIIFLAGSIVSIIYQVALSIKVATNQLKSRDAMRKMFAASFCSWMSLFLLVIIWEENMRWNIGAAVMGFILLFLLASFLAGLSALGLWRWKR